MTYNELVRRIRRLGFRYYSQGKGSHEIWWLPDTERRSSIPRHPGREIATGTLKAILRDLGLSEDDLRNA